MKKIATGWGMALEFHGGLISPNFVAEKATNIQQDRNDERWEQKAILAGRNFGIMMYNKVINDKVRREAIQRARLDYALDYIENKK